MNTVKNDFINAKTFTEYVEYYFGHKQDLSAEEYEILFLIFIKDYYSYKLTLDHLSSYASWINDKTINLNTDYAEWLVSAFELTYYVRQIGYSDTASQQFAVFVTEVKNYFETNKHKLDGYNK